MNGTPCVRLFVVAANFDTSMDAGRASLSRAMGSAPLFEDDVVVPPTSFDCCLGDDRNKAPVLPRGDGTGVEVVEFWVLLLDSVLLCWSKAMRSLMDERRRTVTDWLCGDLWRFSSESEPDFGASLSGSVVCGGSLLILWRWWRSWLVG